MRVSVGDESQARYRSLPIRAGGTSGYLGRSTRRIADLSATEIRQPTWQRHDITFHHSALIVGPVWAFVAVCLSNRDRNSGPLARPAAFDLFIVKRVAPARGLAPSAVFDSLNDFHHSPHDVLHLRSGSAPRLGHVPSVQNLGQARHSVWIAGCESFRCFAGCLPRRRRATAGNPAVLPASRSIRLRAWQRRGSVTGNLAC